MIQKKRLISLAMATIMLTGTLALCIPEKTKGITDATHQAINTLYEMYTPIQQKIETTSNTESKPIRGAEVNIEWTNNGYSKGNVTFSDTTGYYEINTAEGTINITAGHVHRQETEILYVENSSNTFTIDTPPYTYWENITLPAFPENTATITGHVYDKNTNNQLQGNISIFFTSTYFMGSNVTICNTDGAYTLHLPSGEVTVTASARGYYPGDQSISIGKETKTIDFFLEPEPPETALLKGYITNNETHGGIHHASVFITGVNTSYFKYSLTDTTGYYECTLPPGNLSILTMSDEYFTDLNFISIRLNTSEVKWLNMSLVPYPPERAWVHGHVYDDHTGSSLANTPVEVSGIITQNLVNFGSFTRNTTTDTNGYYNVSVPALTAEEIFSGYYINVTRITTISGVADKYFLNSSTGDVIEPGDTLDRDIILEPEPPELCTIKGYIYQDGAPQFNQPPTCSLSASPSLGTAPLPVEFSMIATDTDGTITNWTLDIDNDGTFEYTGTGNPPLTQEHIYTANGTYIAKLLVTDNNGTTGTDTVTITVTSPGNQPPICTLSAYPTKGITPLTVTFTMTASDPDGTIATWTLDAHTDGTLDYTGSGTPPSTQQHIYHTPGNYTATLTVTDDQGATTMDTTDNILVSSEDDTPPTTTIDITPAIPNGENDWYISNVTVTLTGTDNHSEINATYYRIDEDSWLTYTTPFIISQNGEHTIHFYSADRVGNEEDEKSYPIKIDTVPPETTHIVTPSSPNGKNGWYTQTVQVTLSVSDGGISGINSTVYRIDDAPWQRYMGPLTLQDDGNHTLEYFSRDIAGNDENLHALQIKIDTTPPTVGLEKPKEKTLYVLDRELISLPFHTVILGKITLEPHASDTASGIKKTEFFVDDELQYTDINPPHDWVYDESAILFHRHTLKVKTYDAAGHRTETEEINIWIFNL